MLTLISVTPIFSSSTETASFTLPRNAWRSRLISSIFIVAITARICPRMMSCAWAWICGRVSPSRRMAAFSITPGSLEIAAVTVVGTDTRMFSWLSALDRSIGTTNGSRSR